MPMKKSDLAQNRMYSEFAHLWPLISAPEDYAEEAAHWKKVLRDKLGEGRHQILELGVGGGNNLSHLTDQFSATAVDLSPEMLEVCRRLNPDVELHQGDMRSFRLNRKFKAVLIHDAISYMTSEADLLATFVTAAEHLDPGGVLITSPDYFAENFKSTGVGHSTRSDGKIELTYVEYVYDLDLNDGKYETLIFYIIREGGKIRVEQDWHQFGLFPIATWVALMEKAGFVVEQYPYDVHEDNRQSCLLVGTKV